VDSSAASLIRAANQVLIVEGDLDAVGRFFTPGYVAHLTDSDLTGGHEAIRGFVGGLRRAFPDVTVEVEILVEAGDRIAWQRTLRATHLHAFRGFPATGKAIVWRDMVTSRIEEGLMAEDWSISDLAERLLLARKG
jgi:predicted ester cyclase